MKKSDEFRHSRVCGNPINRESFKFETHIANWMPAFAGMTSIFISLALLGLALGTFTSISPAYAKDDDKTVPSNSSLVSPVPISATPSVAPPAPSKNQNNSNQQNSSQPISSVNSSMSTPTMNLAQPKTNIINQPQTTNSYQTVRSVQILNPEPEDITLPFGFLAHAKDPDFYREKNLPSRLSRVIIGGSLGLIVAGFFLTHPSLILGFLTGAFKKSRNVFYKTSFG